MSLRWRLTLVFALGTAALVVISGLVFLGQLRSSLTAALDDTLQTRSAALVARLHAGSLPTAEPDTGRSGGQSGQFSGPDEFTQVLTPGGRLIYPSGAA